MPILVAKDVFIFDDPSRATPQRATLSLAIRPRPRERRVDELGTSSAGLHLNLAVGVADLEVTGSRPPSAD